MYMQECSMVYDTIITTEIDLPCGMRSVNKNGRFTINFGMISVWLVYTSVVYILYVYKPHAGIF